MFAQEVSVYELVIIDTTRTITVVETPKATDSNIDRNQCRQVMKQKKRQDWKKQTCPSYGALWQNLMMAHISPIVKNCLYCFCIAEKQQETLVAFSGDQRIKIAFYDCPKLIFDF